MKKWVMTLAAFAILGMFTTSSWADEAAKKEDSSAVSQMACCKNAADAGMVCMECHPKTKAELGKPAPAFSVKDTEGKEHNLADYKGKVIVLGWTNPDCPFIVRHLKEGSFEQLRSQFPQDKVEMLLIDSTGGATVDKEKQVASDYKLTVPVALDGNGAIGKTYEAKNTPTLYVIDQTGKLAYRGAIDNNPGGNKPEGEVKHYAADAVKALLAGETVKEPSTKAYGCGVHYSSPAAANTSKENKSQG